jgi:hypothetical protein
MLGAMPQNGVRARASVVRCALWVALAGAGCDQDRSAVLQALADNDVPTAELTKVSKGHYKFSGESGGGEACTGTVDPTTAATSSVRFSVTRNCEPLARRDKAGSERQRAECDRGSVRACGYLGNWLAWVPPDGEAEARGVLNKACDKGYFPACGQYALLLFGGRGGPRDHEGARRAETRACEGGQFDRCVSAANMWMAGDGGPPDLVRGRALFKRACGDRSELACAMYGLALKRGDGGPVDLEGARKAFHRGCEVGDPVGCALEKDSEALEHPAAPPPDAGSAAQPGGASPPPTSGR